MRDCPMGLSCNFFAENAIDGVPYCLERYRCHQLGEAIHLPSQFLRPNKLEVWIYNYSEDTLDELTKCGWAEAWNIPYRFTEAEGCDDCSCLEVYYPQDSDWDDEQIEAYQEAGWYEAVDNPNYSDTFLSKEAEDGAREDFPQFFLDIDYYDNLELDKNGTICIMPTIKDYSLEFFGFKPDGSDLL